VVKTNFKKRSTTPHINKVSP